MYLWSLAIVFGVGLCVAGLAALLGVDPEVVVTDPAVQALALALQATGFLVLAVGRAQRCPAPAGALGWRPALGGWWAVPLVLPASHLADRAVELLGAWSAVFQQAPAGSLAGMLAAPGSTPRLLGLVVILLTPLGEELVFRGYVQTSLQGAVGAARAAVLTGLAFGLAHLEPAAAVGAGILGLWLGWLRVQAGSVFPCILAHALNNFAWASLARLGVEAELPDVADPVAAALLVLGFAAGLVRQRRARPG